MVGRLRLSDGGMGKPIVLLESYSNERDRASYSFSGFRNEVVARRPGEVRRALGEVEEAVGEGLHAAGYVAYEAASGLDPVLVTQKSGRMPLVWFGIFENREEVEAGSSGGEVGYRVSTWEPSISRTTYDNTIQRIRTLIKAGDTYQVNYTLRMRSTIEGDAQSFYGDLCETQRTPYSAFIDTGEFQILSTSPELFFSLEKGTLTARPMKGTGRKGRWEGENGRMVDSLRQSPKDRAENLMIVDLLRNDLGRISRTGSVKVKALWEVEQYQTINQMTSTISSEILPNTGLVDMFASLFPCGSVTGAPKSRTMEIISELECSPREVYTGCIGYISPGMEARFNVAIRTVMIDKSSGEAEFGVGGGITYDSSPDGEYGECLVKAKMLSARKTDFQLLETIKRGASGQYFLLSRHLDRLVESSRYFGFNCDIDAVRRALADLKNGSDPEDCTVRLLLNREGEIQVESQPLRQGSDKLRVGFASSPVNSQDEMLFHKTTDRAIYEARLADDPEWDEVILQNERGEVTECCIGNLVVGIDGKRFTPSIECGLLPGTFRAELLERGEVTERVLSVEDVRRADEAFLVNSVRGWVPLEVVG
jgi:para-aminobenzoate synthetase/4-amino-4-deoxychorismate lyase